MQSDEGPDTQPASHGPERNNREYVPASGGTPGHEESRSSGGYAPRGLNRPEQRYTLPASELVARRTLRAATELAGTVILAGAGGVWEVRPATGNQYDISSNASHCDCPDMVRLAQSGYGTSVVCKHCLMVQMQVTAVGPDNMPVSTGWVAALSGLATTTIEGKCRTGEIPATRRNGLWVIDRLDALAWWEVYRLRIVPPR